MRSPLAAAFAIVAGVIVLVGYFVASPILQFVRFTILDWAVILAAVAGLVGIMNLLGAHWRKIINPKSRDYLSLVLWLGFLAAFVAGLVLGPGDVTTQSLINAIQIPVETSLMALLALTLAYSGMRLVQRRKGLMGIVFVISTIVFLVFSSTYLLSVTGVPLLGDILGIVNRLPLAGARGIILGIGLGSLTAGLRVLIAKDRPYSG